MRGLIKTKEGSGFEYVNNLQVPEPGDGELLVRSYAVSVCGSDIVLYDWTKEAAVIAKVPFTPGHETAGLVVKCGPNTRFNIGTRVAIENHFYCGKCYQCTTMKRPDICSNMSQFGHGRGTIYGGCAEYFLVKEIYCYKLRSNRISWRDAALLEPLGVAHNGVTQLDPRQEEPTLVIGCGTIGLLAIGVLKALHVQNILAMDILDNKLELAKKYGANIIINSAKEKNLKERIMHETNNIGVGRILECSGNGDMLNTLLQWLHKGGNVVLVGLPKKPFHIENVIQDIIFKSLQIRSIHGRRIFDTWIKCEELVSRGQIVLDDIVSHHLPLSKFEEGYAAIKSNNAVKVVFDPTL